MYKAWSPMSINLCLHLLNYYYLPEIILKIEKKYDSWTLYSGVEQVQIKKTTMQYTRQRSRKKSTDSFINHAKEIHGQSLKIFYQGSSIIRNTILAADCKMSVREMNVESER